MDGGELVVLLTAVLALFLGLPWLVFHYVTKWKQAKTLTVEDENLLDELHELARRLDERLTTIERIHAADRALAAPEETSRVASLRPRAPSREI